jgi:hypothetical protein
VRRLTPFLLESLDEVGDAVYDRIDPAMVRLAEPAPFRHPSLGEMPGFVAGRCGHRLARSEWDAGFRECERCPASERGLSALAADPTT